MNRLGIRRRLLLVVVTTVAAAVAALLAGFNVFLAHTLDGDARDVLRSRAGAELATLRASGGAVRLGQAPTVGAADRNTWVFSRDGRPLELPRGASAETSAAARALAVRGKRGFADVEKEDLRLYAVPVTAKGERRATVVVALSLAPYGQTRTVALVSSLVFGVILLVLVAVAARWLLDASLSKVTRMTRQAATWSERDLDHRFGLGEPHDEITELAASLDALLDRLAASLRREQRFSAELSHELRTPLARVIAETELALRRDRTPDDYREALETVHRNAEQLGRIVDTLVAAARFEATPSRGTADAYTVVSEAAAACIGLSDERGLELAIEEPARPVRVGVDPDLAERILQPILENAFRYGRNRVMVSIDNSGPAVQYAVVDDGSGVDADERERIFEAGVRGAAANGGGSGLGLALARRLAHSVGGQIEAVPDDGGGRFLVRLPAG
jgi:signal transduction histidine kinase